MSALKSFETSKGTITYDIYSFLSEIRKRPMIWNASSSRPRVDVESCWYDLIRALTSLFDQLKYDEQWGVVKYFRSAWKSQMSLLMRTVSGRQNGDTAHIYRFVRHMEFYLNYRGIKMEDVVIEEDLNRADLLEKKHYEINGRPVLNQVEDNSNTNGLQSCFDNDSFDPRNRCEANTEDGDETCHGYQHQQFVYNARKDVTRNGHITSENESRDTEQAFFDSLKPVLREMNESQKLEFKIQTLKALRKYKTV